MISSKRTLPEDNDSLFYFRYLTLYLSTIGRNTPNTSSSLSFLPPPPSSQTPYLPLIQIKGPPYARKVPAPILPPFNPLTKCRQKKNKPRAKEGTKARKRAIPPAVYSHSTRLDVDTILQPDPMRRKKICNGTVLDVGDLEGVRKRALLGMYMQTTTTTTIHYYPDRWRLTATAVELRYSTGEWSVWF